VERVGVGGGVGPAEAFFCGVERKIKQKKENVTNPRKTGAREKKGFSEKCLLDTRRLIFLCIFIRPLMVIF